MKAKIKAENIAVLEIDIDELEGGWEFLKEEYNRANIPVNVIYPTDLQRAPILLPEFIGPTEVLKGFESASNP